MGPSIMDRSIKMVRGQERAYSLVLMEISTSGYGDKMLCWREIIYSRMVKVFKA